MALKDCYNFNDFRNLAKKKLPSPIFHYIEGGADDETTLKRNTEAFNQCAWMSFTFISFCHQGGFPLYGPHAP